MFRITDMTLAHLDAIYEIETRSFSIPWSKNELRKEIAENKHAIYKVALLEPPSNPITVPESGNMPLEGPGQSPQDFEIVGYAGLWHIINEGHITNIAVDIPYRRMGVGSLLIEELIATARVREMIGLTLEVRIGNAAAQKLYTKYGFKPEGIRKRYYADTGEDAVIMWKYLTYIEDK